MRRKGKSFKACMALLLSLALCVPGIVYTGTAQTVEAEETTGTTAEGLEYTINTENNCVTITGYTGDATEVAIPSEIDGYPVTVIGNEAFNQCSSLTSITIPEGVTSIGNGAFFLCSSLWSIALPDSVTSIGAYAFVGTGYYDKNANWQDNVLYLDGWLINADSQELRGAYTVLEGTKGIAAGAFSYCYLHPFDIYDSFFGLCDYLTDITIPKSVTEIGEDAFTGCENVTICCYWNSEAYRYAVLNGIPVSLFDEPVSVLYGDADENGKVEASDALAVLRAVVNLTTPSDAQTTAADVDGNGKVEASDALLILKHVVNLINTFPAESAEK